MRHLWLTLTQAALFREGYDRATRPGAAQPRGATGRSVPFPRVVVGQGEERTRETEPGAIRQGHAFPAEPAVSVSPAAKLGKAECAELPPRSGASPPPAASPADSLPAACGCLGGRDASVAPPICLGAACTDRSLVAPPACANSSSRPQVPMSPRRVAAQRARIRREG
jgi:hypothetical protein